MNQQQMLITIAQDAYDANQYRGVIGASKGIRDNQKADSAEAYKAVVALIAERDALLEAKGHD